MNTKSILFILVLLVSARVLPAGELTLPTARIGGGGTSAGGAFTVRGKLGEPSPAGTVLSGDAFTVSGGFVSLITVVLTPEAPKLTLKRTATGYEISWPLPAEGFVLEETSALASSGSSNWTNSIVSPTDLDGRRFINLPPNGVRRYFRLNKPVP